MGASSLPGTKGVTGRIPTRPSRCRGSAGRRWSGGQGVRQVHRLQASGPSHEAPTCQSSQLPSSCSTARKGSPSNLRASRVQDPGQGAGSPRGRARHIVDGRPVPAPPQVPLRSLAVRTSKWRERAAKPAIRSAGRLLPTPQPSPILPSGCRRVDDAEPLAGTSLPCARPGPPPLGRPRSTDDRARFTRLREQDYRSRAAICS
jgi:hypothetical protein